MVKLPATTVNCALLRPGGRTTVEAGTGSTGSSLVTDTLTVPPGFATVTEQTADWFGANVSGVHCSAETVGGTRASVVKTVEPLQEAVMVAASLVKIELALTEKPAEAAPAGTRTEAGTVSSDEVPERVAEMPPEGAALGMVNMQEVLPP